MSNYETDKMLSEYAEFHYGDSYFGVANFPKALADIAIEAMAAKPAHKALDIGGVGPDWGLGTPIRSMARAKITAIHLPEDDPKRWGQRLTNAPTARRGTEPRVSPS